MSNSQESICGRVTGISCCGFVLAGGKSSRMGHDKALMPYRGEPLLAQAARLLRRFVPDVCIIGNPEKYSFLGFPVFADIGESRGPISGIYTALRVTSRSANLVLACDMPWVHPQFIALLLEKAAGADAVVYQSRSGLIEPLCSVYTTRCLPAIEDCLARSQFRISEFLEAVRVSYIWEDDLIHAGLNATIFRSVNTPHDQAEMVDENSC